MGRSGTRWATVGLVVLAVAAVALAFAAMRSTRSSPSPTPSGSALAAPSDDPKGGNDNNPDDKQVTDALPETIEPPLLMVDADVAYRGGTGTCLGGADLERTTNGGNAWRPLDVPAEAILDLRTVGADSVQVVGADERCRLRVWASADQGQTWSAPTRPTNLFVRLPDTTRDIATPSGVVANPCSDRDVAPLSIEQVSETEAVVLCFDGDVIVTADAGLTWIARGAVVGAQALAFEGPLLGWVLVRDGGQCPFYQVQVTQDGGATWNLGGCLGEERIEDDRVLPSLSFATPTDGWGDLVGATWLTPDGGQRWRLPS